MKRQNLNKIQINSVRIALFAILTLFLSISCSKENKEYTPPVTDRALTPVLKASKISTMISDSGIIRYRIYTDKWSIFDKADTPYWDFPEGLKFEKFSPDFSIDAQIECNRALYYDKLKIWKLNDSVEATNISGERFKTEELYWNQDLKQIYSDSLITIIQHDKTIIGKGFVSNQDFTKYTIKNPTGIFPISSTIAKDTITDIDTIQYTQPKVIPNK